MVLASIKEVQMALELINEEKNNQASNDSILDFPNEGIDFYKAKKLYEIHLVKRALRQTKGHQEKARKIA